MKSLKKILAFVLSMVLVAGISVSGTLAFLSEADADVNVMTAGSVHIKQHEYERVVNDDGSYKTDTIDSQTSYVLKDFTQGKPLLPATELDANGNPYNHGAGDWDDTTVKMSQVKSYGYMQVFTSKNAVDKFVVVENTGKSDAYIRTLVAIEIGTTDGSLFGTSHHGTWSKNEIGVITIDGNNYFLYEYTYKGGELSDGSWRHENGILPAGDTAYPSLSQVYLNAKATNEDVEKIDGNKNGTIDILVVSQAIQASDFDNAEIALNAGFGDITTTNHPWTDGVVLPDKFVSNFDELKAAFAEGGNILLTDDITVPETLRVEPGVVVNLDLNGKKITVPDNSTSDTFNALFHSENGGDITITGNGTVDLGENGMSLVVTRGNVTIENGTFTRKVTDPNSAYPLISDSKYADGNGVTTIYGGYFDAGYYDNNAANIEELLAGTATLSETADDIAKRGQSGDKNLVRTAIKDNVTGTLNLSKSTFKVYGGTFVGANPAWGDEGCMLPTTPNYLRPWSYYQGAFLDGQTFNENGIVLPAGYSIAQGTTADGRPTYTVNYNG